MSRSSKGAIRLASGVVEIKSKFDAEFRRFSIDKSKMTQFDDFYFLLEELHHLVHVPFIITYTDPVHMDLLPINNNENFNRALSTARPSLKILLQRKGESYGELNGYGSQPVKKRNPISKLINNEPSPRPRIQISLLEDFRRVSAIIDVDIVPETHRRVKLMKNGSDKPLGFYIRDGTSVRITPQGLEKVPAIFISRLVPGGLAESTGLLAVNDEVLEVNGIEVAGKKLDQVTDMMVANSSNLIITVKPVNQHLTLAPQRGGVGRHSNVSSNSHVSHQSQGSNVSYHSAKSYESEPVVEVDEEDEVHDHLSPPPTRTGGLEDFTTERRDSTCSGKTSNKSGSGDKTVSKSGSGDKTVSKSGSGDKTVGKRGSGGKGASNKSEKVVKGAEVGGDKDTDETNVTL